MSNYPDGISDLVLRGVPLTQLHPGEVFWVNNSGVQLAGSSGASDGNTGTFNSPFSTIDKAINSCTASRGDIIICMPGHAETIPLATTIGFDVAGVAIIGLGAGTLRPTLTMSAVVSSLVFSAANMVLQNFLIKTEHDNTIVLEVTGSDSQFINLEFRARVPTTARQWVNCIDIGGASANDCDRTVVSGCLFTSPAVGSTSAIMLSEVAEGVVIENCQVFGDFSDAPIANPTSTVLTNLTVRDCTLLQLQAADHALEFKSACTGNLVRNYYGSAIALIGGVDPGSCRSYECFATDAADVSGALAPTITT